MRIGLVLLFSVIAAAVAGCGGGGATAAGEPASASATLAAKPATVSTRKGQLGTFLVDGRGRTLYLFEKDTGKRSRCSSACAQAWPPLISRGKPVAKGRAKASLL